MAEPSSDLPSLPTPENKQYNEQSFEAEFGIQATEAIERIRNGEGVLEVFTPRVHWGKVPAPLAADPQYLRLASSRWGVRGYEAMFAALGFLALSKFGHTHVLGFAGAWAAAVVALWCVGRMLVYRRRARHVASTPSRL
ncbi:MAG TPA: hypothetical protein VFB39_13440 [Solirubrobacteraceae bacterium]|nr:hypothetical protein [Solirubrobacteraceae bacterium]